jgi:hypothetical protein
MVEQHRLAATDHTGVTAVAEEVGLKVTRLPLTDEEIAQIIGQPSEGSILQH